MWLVVCTGTGLSLKLFARRHADTAPGRLLGGMMTKPPTPPPGGSLAAAASTLHDGSVPGGADGESKCRSAETSAASGFDPLSEVPRLNFDDVRDAGGTAGGLDAVRRSETMASEMSDFNDSGISKYHQDVRRSETLGSVACVSGWEARLWQFLVLPAPLTLRLVFLATHR